MIKQTKSNIFIKNLPPSFNNRSLYDAFSVFGDIFSSKVPMTLRGKNKGFGFVQYKEQRAAEEALSKMDGKEIEGKRISVKKYQNMEKKNPSNTKFTNIYVKDLPPSVKTKGDLDKMFEQFGKRMSIGFFESEFQGKKGYYGFINFENPDQAAAAVREMNGKVFDGCPLIACKALSREQREVEKILNKKKQREISRKFTLHVTSQSNEPLIEATIREELKKYGEIKTVVITKVQQAGVEANSAVGFVTFAKEEDAKKAADEYKTGAGPLKVNMLEGREQRQEKLSKAHKPFGMEYSSMPGNMPMNPGFPQYQKPYRPRMQRPYNRGGNFRGRMPMDPRMMMMQMPRMPMRPQQMPMNYPMQMAGGFPMAMMPQMRMGQMPGPNMGGYMQGMPGQPYEMPQAQMPINMPPGPPPMPIDQQQPSSDREQLGEQLYNLISQNCGIGYFLMMYNFIAQKKLPRSPACF